MMDIAWQDIYYAVATLSMVVVMIAFIWILRILFGLSKLLSNLLHSIQRIGTGIDNIKNLRKNIILGVLRKTIKLLDKESADEQ